MKFHFFILTLIFSISARAGYSCRTADNQTELQMNLGFPTVMVTVRSEPLNFYYHLGYLYELGRLEIVKEQNGQAILEKTLSGYRGLLWAPTSGVNQAWSFELNFAPASIVISDSVGKTFAFELFCEDEPDYRAR